MCGGLVGAESGAVEVMSRMDLDSEDGPITALDVWWIFVTAFSVSVLVWVFDLAGVVQTTETVLVLGC